MKDNTIKCQQALHRYCDIDDVEACKRYCLLNEGERAEVLRWADLLATGLLVTIEGQSGPVQVDVELCTNQIRAVWDASVVRRQGVAADALKAAGVPEIDALDRLDAELGGNQSMMQA